MAHHSLETLSPVGIGEFVMVQDFDASLHPGVNEALIGECADVGEAHTEGGVPFVLPI